MFKNQVQIPSKSSREHLPGPTAGARQIAHGKLPEETGVSWVQPTTETANPVMDEREERLFRSLDFDNDQAMLPRDFERVLAEIGLSRDDMRLRESMAALEQYVEKARSLEED
jgi:hypothetical protein